MRSQLPGVEASFVPVKYGRAGLHLLPMLNLLATVHLVWFYLARTMCEVRIVPYEQGLERTPFQYRLLLMAPLRWAHTSVFLNAAATWLTAQPAWFPHGVRPESLVQAAIDLASVAMTGLVASSLFRRSSRTGLLTPFVYPLTLLLVLSTYSLMTYHAYRFLSDLPGMAVFSVGLYLLYTRAHLLWFAAVFLVGTINRETTLLLLVFFLIAEWERRPEKGTRPRQRVQAIGTAIALLAAWVAWHLWVVHRFRANPSAAGPRLGLNLEILLIPLAWPQLLAACCYLLPCVVVFRSRIADPLLRRWVWTLPVWVGFMLYFGLILEIRIFGELIAFVACVGLLIAEETMLARLPSGCTVGRVQRGTLP